MQIEEIPSLEFVHIKCKTCKRKTAHEISGFEGYNKRYYCKICGAITNDPKNENWGLKWL